MGRVVITVDVPDFDGNAGNKDGQRGRAVGIGHGQGRASADSVAVPSMGVVFRRAPLVPPRSPSAQMILESPGAADQMLRRKGDRTDYG